MSGGVTSAGYTAKTVEEISGEIRDDLLSTIDANLDLSAENPMGQIVGIFSAKCAELWELGQVCYEAYNPDAAEGVALDNVCALSGTLRDPTTRSEVTCTLNLDAGTYLAGTLVANVVGAPDRTFRNKSIIVSSGGVQTGIIFESTEYGPIVANAGTLTAITAPVTGWNSITNPADCTLGKDEETDTHLRVKRQAELAQAGACTADALRAALLEVDGVLQVFVLENDTDVPDANGLPPHSFECIIFDGVSPAADDATIAAVIWANKPTGMRSFGSTSQSTTDSTGASQSVKFSRATSQAFYLTYTVTTTADYPVDGDDRVKAAAVAYANATLNLGVDIIALDFRYAARSITGVVDVPTFTLGFLPSPAGTANLAIAVREIGFLDTSQIVVNS